TPRRSPRPTSLSTTTSLVQPSCTTTGPSASTTSIAWDMYRRNLDIAIAAIVAILGGLAAAAHLSGAVTIPLGVGLFFAPGYLWSEAILSQRLPAVERFMTSAGLALILPIIGGVLFYCL